MRVLVVDDSRAVRSVVGRIMRSLDFDVYEAGNGREALEHLRHHGAPEVALVDWNMPEMNGLDFVREARATYGAGAMQIMMVTSESELPQMVRALEAGANEYLMKPFTVEAMREKLAMLGIPSFGLMKTPCP